MCLFCNKPLINLQTMCLALKQFYKFAAPKFKVSVHPCIQIVFMQQSQKPTFLMILLSILQKS